MEDKSFKERCKEKVDSIVTGVKTKVKTTVNWIKDNPEKTMGILALTGMVLKAGVKGYKTIDNAVSEHRASKEMYCGTVNRKVKLKHQLTNSEIKQLASLMEQGLTRYEALSIMDLIK